jgi:hypothetical protein
MFQFEPDTRSRFQPPGSDWNNPQTQERTLDNETEHNRTLLRGSLGREPEEHELFLAHVQGFHGANQMLRFPDQTPLELGLNPNKIMHNVPSRGGQGLYGQPPQSYPHSPSKNFTEMWKQHYGNISKSVGGAGPGPNDPIPTGQGTVAGGQMLQISDRIPGPSQPNRYSATGPNGEGDVVARTIEGNMNIDPNMPMVEPKIEPKTDMRIDFSGMGKGLHDIGGDAADIPAMENYIRQAAQHRGIDPNVATHVAKSEGLLSYVGDKGSSFGPFQLHYGGIASGGNRVKGLGDEFSQLPGHPNARNPSTVKEQIDFALDHAAQHGWGAFHGAARSGISQFQGIGGSPNAPTRENAAGIPPTPESVVAGDKERAAQKEAALAGPRKELQQAINQPFPAVPKPPDLIGYTEQWRQQHNQGLLQGQWPLFQGLIVGLLALGVGLGGRSYGSAQVAFSGLTGFAEGMHRGNQRQAAKGLADYKQGADALVKQYELNRQYYQDVLTNRELTIGQKKEALQVVAAEQGDKEAAAALQQNDFAKFDSILQKRQQTIQKMQDDHQKADDLHKKYQYDPNYKEKQARQKDVDKAQKHADDAMKELMRATAKQAQELRQGAKEDAAKKLDESVRMAMENRNAALARLAAAQGAMSGQPVSEPPAEESGGAPKDVQESPWNHRIRTEEERKDAISQAKDAIAANAPKDKVFERLQNMGVDPGELE